MSWLGKRTGLVQRLQQRRTGNGRSLLGQRRAWSLGPLTATACSDVPAFGIACSPAWKEYEGKTFKLQVKITLISIPVSSCAPWFLLCLLKAPSSRPARQLLPFIWCYAFCDSTEGLANLNPKKQNKNKLKNPKHTHTLIPAFPKDLKPLVRLILCLWGVRLVVLASR